MSALETKNRLAAACTVRCEFPGQPSDGTGYIDYRAISGFENRIRTWDQGAFTNPIASTLLVLPLGRQYSTRQTVLAATAVFGITGEDPELPGNQPARTTYPQPGLPWDPPRPELVVQVQGIPEAALDAGSPNWLPFGLQFPDPAPLPPAFDIELYDAVAVYIDNGTEEVGIGPYDVSVMVFDVPPNEAGTVNLQANIAGPQGGA